jgi:hypothetical protein
MLFGLTFHGFSIHKFFLDLWAGSKSVYIAVVRQLFF